MTDKYDAKDRVLVVDTPSDTSRSDRAHPQSDMLQMSYAKVCAERDRYLAALKREALFMQVFETDTKNVGGITFRVTRNADGQLVAEEIEALEESK